MNYYMERNVGEILNNKKLENKALQFQKQIQFQRQLLQAPSQPKIQRYTPLEKVQNSFDIAPEFSLEILQNQIQNKNEVICHWVKIIDDLDGILDSHITQLVKMNKDTRKFCVQIVRQNMIFENVKQQQVEYEQRLQKIRK
ncbi:Hypothetical_protein [Hexamita inflata]|uniref:Hypothetical_protein n=1 Tax=Hexamita inflata TaxID=28002 RepID=A0AA86Q4D4_9EUKA|nr:Hypothetical protein HINF_LOCUS39754 [Hexamita inflata]